MMKYYKDPVTDEVYAYDNEPLREGLVAMTDMEVNAHLAPPMLSQEQLIEIAFGERDRRLEVAALRIAPLQDAIDLGDAEPGEESSLLAWKRYRVAVNRVNQQAGYPVEIDWPAPPE